MATHWGSRDRAAKRATARTVLGLAVGCLVAAMPAAARADLHGPLVALGDSFSAGEGAQPDTDSGACHRSSAAWPIRLAAIRKWTAVSFACSGAVIADVTQSSAR